MKSSHPLQSRWRKNPQILMRILRINNPLVKKLSRTPLTNIRWKYHRLPLKKRHLSQLKNRKNNQKTRMRINKPRSNRPKMKKRTMMKRLDVNWRKPLKSSGNNCSAMRRRPSSDRWRISSKRWTSGPLTQLRRSCANTR